MDRDQDEMGWWREARYGMFIHWGLYSHLGGEWQGWRTTHIGEWIMCHRRIPRAQYASVAASFNPVDFNAGAWVDLCRRAGARYLVITAKHHDGFAMYRSTASSYNIVDATPFGRDPLAELAEACRATGIKLCFYYSQVQDWYEQHAVGNTWDWPEGSGDFRTYMDEKCKPQLRELLTQYGEIGLIWFDTPLNVEPAYCEELRDYVKQLQPTCIVSGRIGHHLGQYVSTGDNMIPSVPLHRDWEVPATLNGTWGFKASDTSWKSPSQVLRLMTRINSRGGNYLLNIGPTGTGVIPAASVAVLEAVGGWLHANGEAIYGTRPAPLFPYEPALGEITTKPGWLFLHLFTWSNHVMLHGLGTEVRRVFLLADPDRKLDFEWSYTTSQRIHRLSVDIPGDAPDDLCSVLAVELADSECWVESLDYL